MATGWHGSQFGPGDRVRHRYDARRGLVTKEHFVNGRWRVTVLWDSGITKERDAAWLEREREQEEERTTTTKEAVRRETRAYEAMLRLSVFDGS